MPCFSGSRKRTRGGSQKPRSQKPEWDRSLGSILASGFWLLASGFWLLASGFWLLASGFWLLASGFWLLASGFWLLASGFHDPIFANCPQAAEISLPRFFRTKAEMWWSARTC